MSRITELCIVIDLVNALLHQSNASKKDGLRLLIAIKNAAYNKHQRQNTQSTHLHEVKRGYLTMTNNQGLLQILYKYGGRN